MKQQLKNIQEKFLDAADAFEEAKELLSDFQEEHAAKLDKDGALAGITEGLYEIADQGFYRIDVQEGRLQQYLMEMEKPNLPKRIQDEINRSKVEAEWQKGRLK